MELIIESSDREKYLEEYPPIISYSTPLIQKEINKIKVATSDKEVQAKMAYELARDRITHTFDSKSDCVTINAEDVLAKEEGICFAKAHLLASLLRGLQIPVGFCYQRVFKNGKDASAGFALHGLNAIYLSNYGWFRVDPRGNKVGVDAQFSPTKEKLAYPIHKEQGEVDYPNVFVQPLQNVIEGMNSASDFESLFNNRPTTL